MPTALEVEDNEAIPVVDPTEEDLGNRPILGAPKAADPDPDPDVEKPPLFCFIEELALPPPIESIEDSEGEEATDGSGRTCLSDVFRRCEGRGEAVGEM